MLKFTDILAIPSINITHIRLADSYVKSAEFSVTTGNLDLDDHYNYVTIDYKIIYTCTTKTYKTQANIMSHKRNKDLRIDSTTNGDADQSLNFIKKCIEFSKLIADNMVLTEIIAKYEVEFADTKSNLFYNDAKFRNKTRNFD